MGSYIMKGFDTMSIFEIIAGVALILCGLVIIALVCMQEPKGGLGTVAGGADMYASMQKLHRQQNMQALHFLFWQ